MESMYTEWLEPGEPTDSLLKTLRNISQADREKMPAEDFAGPNMSFPIEIPGDVADAARSIGRAKGDRAAIKRKIVAIAYRKGDSYVAQLPDGWKRDQGKVARMVTAARTAVAQFFGVKAAQDAGEMGSGDLKQKLHEALKEVEPSVVCVEDYFPVTDPAHVVYTVAVPDGIDPYGNYPIFDYVLYERAFDLSDSGVVTLSKERFEVHPVMRWEPVEGASPTVASQVSKDAAQGAPCSCQHREAPAVASTKEEKNMKTKAELVTFLETATEEQLQALSAAAEGKKPEAPVVAAAAVETPKTPSFDELLASAPAETRDAIQEGVRIGKEKKAATIKALKDTGRCTFSDEALGAMSQAQLDQLVSLAGSNVRAAVDHSVNGPRDNAVRDASQNEGDGPDAPPSMTEAITAARQK